MKKLLVILLVLAAVPCYGFTVISGHPRMFINTSNLPTFQNRAATTHLTEFQAIVTWCDTYWTNDAIASSDYGYDHGILRYALVYRLGTIPGITYGHSISAYGDRGAALLVNGSLYIWWRAIAYDWLYDRLTPSQRSILVGKLVTTTDAIQGSPLRRMNEYGYRYPEVPCALWSGLAFYGDGINDTKAQSYVDWLESSWLEDMKAPAHAAGPHGGGYSLGFCYQHGMNATGNANVPFAMYALYTATTLSIADTFGKYGNLNGFAEWWMNGIQPGPPSPGTEDISTYAATAIKYDDCGAYAWNFRKDDLSLDRAIRIIASIASLNGDTNKAKSIMWFLNTRIGFTPYNETFNIIFNNKSIVPADPDTLGIPRTKAFGWDTSAGTIDTYLATPQTTAVKAGLGEVFMRSSWSSEQNTTYSVFRSPPFHYFGHQHFDSLAFSIYKGEPLALPNSGVYYNHYEGGEPDNSTGGGVGMPHVWYYARRQPSANTLLIMNPNETVYMAGRGYKFWTKYKDGGGRMFSDIAGTWGDVLPNQSRDFGGLIKHEDAANYTYTSADATKAYNSTVGGVNYLNAYDWPGVTAKTSLVQRDYTYLKSSDGNRDYFVVFDRVNSTDPTYRKVFLLHTSGEPISAGGTWSKIYGNSSTGYGLFQSTDTTTFTIAGALGKGKLFMKTLLPSSTTVYKMGGQVTTTLTAGVNNTDGTIFRGAKVDLNVASTADFPDKPVVVVDNEAFQCDGKTTGKITGCIRGARYWMHNTASTHSTGATVIQQYRWMIREADTNSWVAYPHDFGDAHLETSLHISESNDYGKWALRVENGANELHTNFLHVLHPTVDMGRTSMGETALIDAGNMAGTLIKDSPNARIVIFTKMGALQSSLTYRASYSGNGKHLITGLEYGIYDIYRDGEKIDSKQTSNQNILSFESSGGGNFRLVKTG